MTTTVSIYIACVFGILARTLVPYLLELKDNPGTKFNRKYLTGPIAALAINLLAAPFVFSSLPTGVDWVAAFILGWGTSDITREITKLTPLKQA